jgi:cytochrome c-type biogenesis protein CcmF
MNEGSALLWISLILTVASAASLSLHLLKGQKVARKLAQMLLLVDFGVISAAFLLMVYYFLSSNMTIYYVLRESRTDYALQYKLAGAWAGDEGSLLLWTWLLSLSNLLFFIWRKNDSEERAQLRSLGSVILLTILAAFLCILLISDPFRPTPPEFLANLSTSNGLGLSPLLLTPLTVVHPPLEFASYAIITIPFATAAAHLLSGKDKWTRISMQWTRSAWLFLTLALVIGALWSYTVLGWGGYWAWDPVQTANLTVWLPLTALVHAQLWNRRKGQFAHLAPALASIVFALAMFATFETRTGIIASVHSFIATGGVQEDLGARLLDILGSGGAAPPFFTLMAVSLLATAALFMLHFAKMRKREGRTSGAMAVVPWAFLAVYLMAIVWSILDIKGITGAVLSVAGAISFGNGALGFALLAMVFIGVPLLWMLATSPSDETSKEGKMSWISDDNAMSGALALFILWTLVTLALMILGANALSPGEFEGRLPFLLIPVGAVLFAILTWRLFTKRRLPIVLVILVSAILASYFLFASNIGAMYFPLALAIIFAVSLRISKSWAPAILSRNLRIAAMLTLISLLLAFVMWSSGITSLGLRQANLQTTVPLDITLAALSLVGLLLLALAVSKHDIRLWVCSMLVGAVLIGFVIGLALSMIALALVIQSRREFLQKKSHGRVSFTSVLRGASPQLVHLGVALLILGYASSTYFASNHDVTAFTDRASNIPSGYRFQLLDSSGVDVNGDTLYEEIAAIVDVSDGGEHLFTLSLKMMWQRGSGGFFHYASDPLIRSDFGGDLYFTFTGFNAGNQNFTVNDQPDPLTHGPYRTDNSALTSVWFGVRENPMMASLWGGGWLMAAGICIRMWSEATLYRKERAKEKTIAS